jgi:hypothetical protein
VHRSSPATAQIFGATGGYYCRYAISHTGGNLRCAASVEDIAVNWERIGDGSLPNELDGERWVGGPGLLRPPASTRRTTAAGPVLMADNTFRVVVWLTGGIGTIAARAVADNVQLAVQPHAGCGQAPWT